MPDENELDVDAVLEHMKNVGHMPELPVQRSSLDLQGAMEREREREKQRKQMEETQRFEAAVAAFTRFGPVPALWICPYCSATVAEREHHVRFHDAINASMAQGEWAAFINTPIGGWFSSR